MPTHEPSTSISKQHAVPQNVLEVEFKIIGELTMRQFVYLLVFGGMTYGLYTFGESPLRYILMLFLVLLGLGLAFVPINERNLDIWITNFFKAVYSDTQLIWKKEPKLLDVFSYHHLDLVRNELVTLAPTSSRRKLEEFLEHQDKLKTQDILDIPEQEYTEKIRLAFFKKAIPAPELATNVGLAPAASQTSQLPTSFAPQIVTPPLSQPDQKQQPPQPELKGTTTIPAAGSRPPMTTAPQPSATHIITAVPSIQVAPTTPRPQPVATTTTPGSSIQGSSQPQVIKPASQLPPNVRPQVKPLEAYQKPYQQNLSVEYHYSPDTPGQHVGRRFINLLPKQGELILPVRGEKVLDTEEEQKIENTIEEKTKQLKTLIEQIRAQESVKATAPVTQPHPAALATPGQPATQPTTQTTNQTTSINQDASINLIHRSPVESTQQRSGTTAGQDATQVAKQQAEELLGNKAIKESLVKLQDQNKKLVEEMESLRREIQKTKNQAVRTQKLQTLSALQRQKAQTFNSYKTLKETVSDISDILLPKRRTTESAQPETAFQTEPISNLNEQTIDLDATSAGDRTQELNGAANIIRGTVSDPSNAPITNIVVIIKNENDEPVRAIKTNALGRFEITTPLASGMYTLETDKSKKTKYVFDTVKVEVRGEIVPPISLVGKIPEDSKI